MNELARIVHDLVTGQAPRAECLAGLSPQERAALEDLTPLVRAPAPSTNSLFDRLVAYDWAGPPMKMSQ
ncbi:MAG: hypothetical protein M1570_10450 [Chloroflexi bacterium]|nr:hypothetical protein [Chloroflexota bacterium]